MNSDADQDRLTGGVNAPDLGYEGLLLFRFLPGCDFGLAPSDLGLVLGRPYVGVDGRPPAIADFGGLVVETGTDRAHRADSVAVVVDDNSAVGAATHIHLVFSLVVPCRTMRSRQVKIGGFRIRRIDSRVFNLCAFSRENHSAPVEVWR